MMCDSAWASTAPQGGERWASASALAAGSAIGENRGGEFRLGPALAKLEMRNQLGQYCCPSRQGAPTIKTGHKSGLPRGAASVGAGSHRRRPKRATPGGVEAAEGRLS